MLPSAVREARLRQDLITSRDEIEDASWEIDVLRNRQRKVRDLLDDPIPPRGGRKL
jgi:hypothetical protein